MTKIAVLGGGAWGTALTVVLAHSRRAHEVALWVRNAATAETMRATRQNARRLPGVEIPREVEISNDLREVLDKSYIVICAAPAMHVREVFSLGIAHLAPESILVSATKGLEPATHLRISQVISQACSQRFHPQVAVLSGPSFAEEAARGEFTNVVIASPEFSIATYLQEEFTGPGFRLETSGDPVGVELMGAVKNVMAIGAGACQGLGLGQAALAAFITRAANEMRRLGTALGVKPETITGLAGTGRPGADVYWNPEPKPSCRIRTGARARVAGHFGGNDWDRGRSEHRTGAAGFGSRESGGNADRRTGSCDPEGLERARRSAPRHTGAHTAPRLTLVRWFQWHFRASCPSGQPSRAK